jgi:predicted transcriptional regulator
MKTVKDVMSAHPISAQENAPLKEIAARLRELRVSALPVLGDDGTVIGVVSEADLVTVKDGIVTLEGTPETAAIGRQVLSAVRRVQGVVAVRDRLVEALPQVPASPGPYF